MVTRKFPHLLSPLKVGPLTLKNRIEAAPTSLAELSPDSYLTRENIAYYRLKAKGGAAVVTIGESIVHTPTGKSHPKQIPLDDKGVIPSLVEAADAIHQYGALASIELSHGGMECDPVFLGGRNPIGPSARTIDIGFRTAGARTVEVEEMSEALMDEIAEAYAEAAATVKTAGFDMCMVHAAHGWLLAQFLSPLVNRRTDKYGGSLENRARFPMMVLDRIRERVGSDFPIEFRMGGSELAEGGYTIEDAVALAKMVENKVDLLHVSAGAHYFVDTMTIMHPSMFLPHGCNVYLAEAVKKVVDIPVTTVGGLSDPAQMEEIIESGKADVIAIAPIAPPSMQALVQTAIEKQVPIILNGVPADYGLDGLVPGVSFSTIDYEAQGAAMGEELGTCINEKLDGTAEVIYGQSSPGTAGKEEIEKAFEAALTATAPDAELVTTVEVTDRSESQKRIGDALQGNPNAKAVAGVNDEGALGAIGAYKAAGKELPCVVEAGGNEEALAAAESGEIYAVVALQFEADMAQSFDTLVAMIDDPSMTGVQLTVPQEVVKAGS